jgi:hypothetical protein
LEVAPDAAPEAAPLPGFDRRDPAPYFATRCDGGACGGVVERADASAFYSQMTRHEKRETGNE